MVQKKFFFSKYVTFASFIFLVGLVLYLVMFLEKKESFYGAQGLRPPPPPPPPPNPREIRIAECNDPKTRALAFLFNMCDGAYDITDKSQLTKKYCWEDRNPDQNNACIKYCKNNIANNNIKQDCNNALVIFDNSQITADNCKRDDNKKNACIKYCNDNAPKNIAPKQCKDAIL